MQFMHQSLAQNTGPAQARTMLKGMDLLVSLKYVVSIGIGLSYEEYLLPSKIHIFLTIKGNSVHLSKRTSYGSHLVKELLMSTHNSIFFLFFCIKRQK